MSEEVKDEEREIEGEEESSSVCVCERVREKRLLQGQAPKKSGLIRPRQE